ncbi:MAG: orotate phosphoribosyltransferase [Alphaproteobacteria bacterium]|nr:MAG: orotate phosphoribosyltransferase [Alphaproteobacteria bacterium]
MSYSVPYYSPKVIADQASKILIETEAVLFNAEEPFTYTSGRKGPVYVDCRKLISFPHARGVLMDMAASLIGQNIGYESLDIIAGGETAGIPYAAFLSERMNLPMAYVRKQPKGFGRMAQIEGDLAEGSKVILVEDLQTDGGSKKIFVNALREAGAQVDHAFVIFHYGIFEASQKNMDDLGITLHSLTSWPEVVKTARDNNYFDTKTLDSVQAFLDNPVQWSVDHGGKGEE